MNHLQNSIQELEETLQSERASLYGETKSSAGDKYETQREMIQSEIQRTKSQWSLKNEQLESLYTINAWEQQATEKQPSHLPFSTIRNGSIVHLTADSTHLNGSSVTLSSNKSTSKSMWLFIGVSVGDLQVHIIQESDLPSTNNSTIPYTLKTLTTESPLGTLLLGKKAGDSIILNNKSFSILNCF